MLRKPLGLVRRFSRETHATAGTEFVLMAPVALILMSLISFAGESFEVQRKVTMTLRTLTDLVSQQCDVGPNATVQTAPCPQKLYTYTQIVNAASTVMAPFDTSSLAFTIGEIQTNGSKNGTGGTQVWCKFSAGAGACPGGVYPASLSTSPNIIFGSVQYKFSPLGIWFNNVTITFSDSFYFLPRLTPPSAKAASVACSGC